MAAIKPQHLTRELTALINNVAFASTNEPDSADLAHRLFIGQVLTNAAAPFIKAKDQLRKIYAVELSEPCDEFELLLTTDVTITAKVGAPRSTFDRDTFIKQLADRLDLSVIELTMISEQCTKESAAPVSMNAKVMHKGETE